MNNYNARIAFGNPRAKGAAGRDDVRTLIDVFKEYLASAKPEMTTSPRRQYMQELVRATQARSDPSDEV